MNISDQLSIIAREQPDKSAYFFNNQEVTYQQLDVQVTQFASSLRELGYRQGDHIALIVGNSPYFVIGMYGALRLGAKVIPVNPIYTPDELQYILRDGDVKAIITMDVLLEKFKNITKNLHAIQHIIVGETGNEKEWDAGLSPEKMKSLTSMVREGSPKMAKPTLEDEEVAVILYTSGTTGKPKGAMLTHKNLFSNAKDVADYLEMDMNDKVIAALPMFHVFCLTVALNAPLMNGGTVMIVPSFSPDAVFKIAKEQEATVFAGVPTMYNYLLQTPGDNVEAFRTIRLCISGGASMPVALLKNFEEKFKVQISEGYGLSEASPVTCFNPLDRERKPGSIGTSISHVENRVVDEAGEELPAGEVGELIVRGPNVMAGYYNLPDETAFALRDGWLYTGDMARMDEEGYFYIVDRRKDMILVGGYNVYPREIEEAIYEHPDVAEVAVVGAPDPDTGEKVIAFVVAKSEQLTETSLDAFCRERLAKYKIPAQFEFLEELPKNTTGKILKNPLREKVAASHL